MRWLITGGGGFIGSHLVDAILDRRLGDVVVLDNFRRGHLEYLSRHIEDPRLRVLKGDVTDPLAVGEACRDVTNVVHLAAHSNVLGSEALALASCEANVMGTLNVLDTALKAGAKRLVFSSSREVYGDPASLPVTEDTLFAPKNLYGASKASGEMYCQIYRKRGLDVRILRLGNAYGWRDTDRVIPIWLERAQNDLPLQVFGGKQVLDLIWIDFVVEGLLRAAEIASLEAPVNVASGQGTPILDLAQRVIEVCFTQSRIEMLPAREQEVVGFVADVGRMRSELHLEPPSDPLAYLSLMKPRRLQGVL